MTKLYHPESREVVEAEGSEVKAFKGAGFVVVGNRPPGEYMGKTREEILAFSDDFSSDFRRAGFDKSAFSDDFIT